MRPYGVCVCVCVYDRARGHVRACECMSLSQVHQLMCVSASVFSGMRAAAEEFEAQGCPERPCHASPGLPSLPPSLQNTCGGVTSKRASSIHTNTMLAWCNCVCLYACMPDIDVHGSSGLTTPLSLPLSLSPFLQPLSIALGMCGSSTPPAAPWLQLESLLNNLR